jgi:BON domain
MTSLRSSLLGAGLGATSMFLLDPARGARRRALIRDKMASARRKTAEAAGATWRDLGNRFDGLQSQTRGLFSDRAIDDATVEERVKSALGRVTAHRRAISVRSANQYVMLTGDALASEIGSIVSAVQRVRGVASVENNIRTHATAEGVPLLQGGSRRARQWTTWFSEAWSPTALLAAGAALAIAVAAIARGRGDGISAEEVTSYQ